MGKSSTFNNSFKCPFIRRCDPYSAGSEMPACIPNADSTCPQIPTSLPLRSLTCLCLKYQPATTSNIDCGCGLDQPPESRHPSADNLYCWSLTSFEYVAHERGLLFASAKACLFYLFLQLASSKKTNAKHHKLAVICEPSPTTCQHNRSKNSCA